MIRPEIILGPPGTGKTTQLLELVDDELERGVPPDRIGFVSFTKRAAREAVERACKKFSLRERDLPYFRTLHSLCFRTLSLSSSDVFEGWRLMREFSGYSGLSVSGRFSMDEGSTFGNEEGDRILFMDNLARVRGVTLQEQFQENSDDLDWARVLDGSQHLQQFKSEKSLIDYTDMLEMFVEGSWAPPLEVLFVDEAQDLSRLQWLVGRKLASRARRVVIAGDDDQAIFRWSGADVERFLAMEGDVRVLGQSWRVPRRIQAEAQRVITRVGARRPKDWAARDDEGVLDFETRPEYADFSGEDVLVLARNVYLLKDIEDHLRDVGVFYESRSKLAVDREILEAVYFWELLRKGKRVSVDGARLIYKYMEHTKDVRHGYKALRQFPDDSEVGMVDLRERGGLLVDDSPWYEALSKIKRNHAYYLRHCRSQGEQLMRRPRVRLSTIHGSKGGEADHVILLTDMAKRTHAEVYRDHDSEVRVWYVAMTRAKRRLTICQSQTGRSFI